MKYSVLLLLSLASQIQAANWPLDDITDTVIVRGTAKTASGVFGQSLVLDGASLIELKESAQLTSDRRTADARRQESLLAKRAIVEPHHRGGWHTEGTSAAERLEYDFV
jgi:hypothetical protein